MAPPTSYGYHEPPIQKRLLKLFKSYAYLKQISNKSSGRFSQGLMRAPWPLATPHSNSTSWSITVSSSECGVLARALGLDWLGLTPGSVICYLVWPRASFVNLLSLGFCFVLFISKIKTTLPTLWCRLERILCKVSKSVPGAWQILTNVVAMFKISLSMKDTKYNGCHIKSISHVQRTETLLIS